MSLAPDPSQFLNPYSPSNADQIASALQPTQAPSQPAVGSTADLENSITPAAQTLGNALQQQNPAAYSGSLAAGMGSNQPQPPIQPQQQPGQNQQDDPLGPVLQSLAQRHQELSEQAQHQGGGVKQLLGNYFGAMFGQAPVSLKLKGIENQMAVLTNARSMYLDRQAEAASRQAQLQFMNQPLTASEAQAIGHPELSGQVVPPSLYPVISSEDRGREAAQLQAQQRADQLKENTPSIQMPLDQGTANLLGIPQDFVGRNLSAADWRLIDSRSQALGYQKFDKGFDGPQGGVWMADRAGNLLHQMTPISETARATKLAQAGAAQVYAVPSEGGNPVLTTQGAAQANGMYVVRPATPAENAKAITAHNKAYVQPAEQVEKSYQMMQSAYNDYQQARAQGQDLPTGAQSMVALSTHLSTTFGNVKGARITKDMIQEHLGARSVSDGAQVAIQRLTNGDVLSPAQWSAFHDLISQSRMLSWKTASTEAQRAAVPTNFLPPDLSGLAKSTGNTPAGGFDWNTAPKVQ